MRRPLIAAALVALLAAGAASVTSLGARPARAQDAATGADRTAQLLARTDRKTAWTQTGSVPLQFDTFHPQGMVHIGHRWFMTSVEIITPTVKCNPACDGFDRTPGEGVGHLFVFDESGKLLNDVHLGSGTVYHPGGLDYDGKSLWIPVAEYRPHSRAIVYKVDPGTLDVQQAFTVADHIGGLIAPKPGANLRGVNWGSRTFYEFTPDGQVVSTRPNPDDFIDFQDCHHLGEDQAVCGGIAGLTGPSGSFELGGLSLLDTDSMNELNAFPLLTTSQSAQHHVLTRNPVWVDGTDTQLRLSAVPDDNPSSLLTFTATP